MSLDNLKLILLLPFLLLLVGGCSDNEESGTTDGGKLNVAGYESATLKHPGCLFGLEDLEYLSTVARNEPTAYNKFIAQEKALMGYSMKGPFKVVGREPNLNLVEYESDGMAVFFQAIQWYMTENEQYAKNAMRILRAWATTHKEWSGTTARLTAGDTSMLMAAGAEILRACYIGWESELNGILENYFMNVVWPIIGGNTDKKTLEALSAANQGAMELRGAIAIAAFLDDKEMFDNVMEAAIYHPAAGLLYNFLPSGQYSDFGRDMGHAGGMLMDWAKIAEIAWHQGVDLYGLGDNRLMKATEYYCEYCMTDIDWKDRYELFGAQYSWYRAPSSNRGFSAAAEEDRRNDKHDWLNGFYLYKGAYENRKGLPVLQWTTKYADKIESVHGLEVEEIFLYTRQKHAETASIPVIKEVSANLVMPLELTIENNKYDAILSQEDGGNYVLSGKGRMSGACSMAYYKMQGDGAFIAKLNNITVNNQKQIGYAGLMIRESMEDDISHSWVYTNYNGTGLSDKNYVVTFYDKLYNYRFEHSFDPKENTPMFPIWLKIERQGNRIASYDSYDGKTWVANGFKYKKDSELQDAYLIGMVVTCNDSNISTTVEAEFSEVQLLEYK